jgi:periplasmic protein TonB
LLELVVDRAGAVTEITVISSPHPSLVTPAMDAVRQWTFVPGQRGGQAVNARIRVPLVFPRPE